jgi:hypothetical protein
MIDPSHQDLLDAAATLRRCAIDDDADQFEQQLLHLKALIVEHLRSEEGYLTNVTDPTRALVEYGQRRLLNILEQLLHTAADAVEASPMVDSTTLAIALRRQARLEEVLLPITT